MPFEPYTRLHTLAGSHVSGVNVLAFSSCGRYLASGSNDKSIIIWDPISGKSLQRIFVKDEVSSLIWHPRNCALYFGCQDGTLIVVENFSPKEENTGCEVLTGITASVDALDVDAESNYLAIGVGSEVQVSKKITEYTYATFVIMPSPPKLVLEKEGDDERIRPRSVHLLPGGSQLIVSYLNHGIVYACTFHRIIRLLGRVDKREAGKEVRCCRTRKQAIGVPRQSRAYSRQQLSAFLFQHPTQRRLRIFAIKRNSLPERNWPETALQLASAANVLNADSFIDTFTPVLHMWNSSNTEDKLPHKKPRIGLLFIDFLADKGPPTATKQLVTTLWT
ncbi:uncharacterized protein LACBIDRAFT_330383 [Laccaria bicolor S238N-H82]|uniref:Predicted protein n=1 Tax=Laccaria bicolor (strain S238N-H82 / ATCC MYA-4686) TaxID=486041 RepID=B0DL50_LACBS|nr:uncharacterized protein LACBIDRAFT_330383 [Laccaria bicolor S238N-H82]EDR04847.1 predicted protein [Laccaria bicolor S238N-H82]|eukprot:XP_001884671.1 predicted protein [Laccaria bicolor S238N-H82]